MTGLLLLSSKFSQPFHCDWVGRCDGVDVQHNQILTRWPFKVILYSSNLVQGSHLTWKTLKTWNFVIFFSRSGKCLECAQKVVKTWNFNLKPGKTVKFANFMFQVPLFKMSFTKIILIYFFVISTLSTQTLIQSYIDLGFHCFYLKITWKIHGILCHKRSGNPVVWPIAQSIIMRAWLRTLR